MKTEELNKSHTDQLVSLIKKIYKENSRFMLFGQEPSDGYLEDMLSTKMMMAENGEAVDIVVLENGGVIGECEIVRARDNKFKVGIFLDHMHRRKGMGKALLEEALGMARALRIKSVYAEVDVENGGAARFFERLGFEDAGEESIKGRRCKVLEKKL